MNRKKVYICQTVYQLLLSLIKRGENDHILFLGSSRFPKDALERLQQEPNIRIEQMKRYGIRLVFFQTERIEEINYFKQFDEIYLYIDHREMGAFLTKHQLAYHLIEDGLDFFQHELPPQVIYTNRLKEAVYKRVYPLVYPAGNSVMCQTIEVNNLEVIKPYPYHDNFIEVPRASLFAAVSNEKKEMLQRIFQLEHIKESTTKKALILTQPLYNDLKYLKMTKQDQKEFYSSIVAEYQATHDIYVKVHPRDEVDYTDMKNIHLLTSYVPMELYELLGSQVVFDVAITYSSTAIEQLNNVKEKRYYTKEKRNDEKE